MTITSLLSLFVVVALTALVGCASDEPTGSSSANVESAPGARASRAEGDGDQDAPSCLDVIVDVHKATGCIELHPVANCRAENILRAGSRWFDEGDAHDASVDPSQDPQRCLKYTHVTKEDACCGG